MDILSNKINEELLIEFLLENVDVFNLEKKLDNIISNVISNFTVLTNSGEALPIVACNRGYLYALDNKGIRVITNDFKQVQEIRAEEYFYLLEQFKNRMKKVDVFTKSLILNGAF